MSFWQTEKVKLRGVEPEDWEVLFKWNADGDMSRQLDFLWPPTSQEQAKAFASKAALQKLENDTFHWIIEDTSGNPVGSISTHDCDSLNGNFTYGVYIFSWVIF